MPISKSSDDTDCCCGLRSGVIAAVAYTMACATAGLVIGILYGIVFIGNFDADIQYRLRVAFGIAIAWSSLQLPVSILCLIGVFIEEKRLLAPFMVVKFLSTLLYFAGNIAIAVESPPRWSAVIIVAGSVLTLIEWYCAQHAADAYDKIGKSISVDTERQGREEDSAPRGDGEKNLLINSTPYKLIISEVIKDFTASSRPHKDLEMRVTFILRNLRRQT